MAPPFQQPLAAKTKLAFQVLGALATIAVVAIHYRSSSPKLASPLDATWNSLAQEFLLGGISRVAVPIFALAAGLFYFISCDGTLAHHLVKQRARITTLVVPYLIAGGVAAAASLAFRFAAGDPARFSFPELLMDWWIRPPAEQLWFLRDLILLTLLAPVIGWVVHRAGVVLVAVLATAWAIDLQPFPVVHGWYLINIETLLFFSAGALFASRTAWLERVTHCRLSTARMLAAVWIILVTARVWTQPNFDAWYVTDYTVASLLLHQASILVGMLACLAWAARAESSVWPKLSGLSFFVYLVHEFPLRAVVARFAEMTSLGVNSFWITAPVVIAGCYLVGWHLSRWTPTVYAIFTGGRTPNRAMSLVPEVASSSSIPNVPCRC